MMQGNWNVKASTKLVAQLGRQRQWQEVVEVLQDTCRVRVAVDHVLLSTAVTASGFLRKSSCHKKERHYLLWIPIVVTQFNSPNKKPQTPNPKPRLVAFQLLGNPCSPCYSRRRMPYVSGSLIEN